MISFFRLVSWQMFFNISFRNPCSLDQLARQFIFPFIFTNLFEGFGIKTGFLPMGERFLQKIFLTGNSLLSSAGILLSVGGLHQPKKEETRGSALLLERPRSWPGKPLWRKLPTWMAFKGVIGHLSTVVIAGRAS